MYHWQQLQKTESFCKNYDWPYICLPHDLIILKSMTHGFDSISLILLHS